jgi:hypothetical protein
MHNAKIYLIAETVFEKKGMCRILPLKNHSIRLDDGLQIFAISGSVQRIVVQKLGGVGGCGGAAEVVGAVPVVVGMLLLPS